MKTRLLYVRPRWNHAPKQWYRVWIVVRWGSGWIGYHWSGKNRRLCVNLVPWVTIAITFPGGVEP